MQEATILLVEGKNAGVASHVAALEKVGYRVVVAYTGAAAVKLTKAEGPDLVVFDASTMRSNGVRSCKKLRAILREKPIIHCRSLDQAEDHSACADIYLVQPFTSRKLLNRIHDLLPADDLEGQIVRCGDIVIYWSKSSVSANGTERHLTPKLARMLEEFVRHPNEVVTRKQLMANVWNTDYVGDTRTLDVHIRWARECIEEDPAAPQLLQTVRGKGYIFVPPDGSQP